MKIIKLSILETHHTVDFIQLDDVSVFCVLGLVKYSLRNGKGDKMNECLQKQ